MFRQLACVLLAAASLSVAAPARAAPSEVGQGVHVIGDSVAWRAARGVLSVENRPAGWTIDAFPGRRVTALANGYVPRTEDEATAETHAFDLPRARISTAVLALGTNGADEVLTVAQAAGIYAAGIRTIRARNVWNRGVAKNVVLVMPWKEAAIEEGVMNAHTGEPYQPYTWASKTTVYRQAIARVAANSGNVCVMRWDQYASTHPARFPDGIHPDALGL